MEHQPTIGIIKEQKSKWERWVAITPTEVKKLVDSGIWVLVQPSTTRVFNEDEFIEAGAVVQEDISSADLIIGVKEVPIKELLPNKTYMFFSHTIKA